LTAEQARSERDTATGRLLRAYHARGDLNARDRLVDTYLPLVETLAHRHGRRDAEHDDLVQAGSIGLLGAIERFDLSRGTEFTAFAVPTIVGEIKRHLRDRQGAVRLPRRLQEADARLPAVREELTASLGRRPTVRELAKGLELEPEELARLAEAHRSRQEPEQLAAAGEAEPDDRVMLAGAFAALDDSERRIVYLRYMRDMNTEDVAKAVGLSERQLSRRTAAALDKLRRKLEGNQLEGIGGAHEAPGPAGSPRAAGPKPAGEHSGRLLLRMPNTLHGELARIAEREHVSLNQFITNALAAAVGWRRPGEEDRQAIETGRSEEAISGRSPRWLPAALITNIVIVVVAGILALVLLLVAWQQGF
jgi:RNA polymerase sigma-B factor